jgi:hypothetical protein
VSCLISSSICNKQKQLEQAPIEKQIYNQINQNNEKCKYQKPNKDPCPNCLFPIDYENEIHFLCIKHHYKYIKSQYSKFKDDNVEFLRTILQPKTDLLTYQSIMSQINFSKWLNKSVSK